MVERDTIFEIATSGEAGLHVLAAALTAAAADEGFAPVVSLLQNEEAGPFTVFAPTDQAFVDLVGVVNTECNPEPVITDLAVLVGYVGLPYVIDVFLVHGVRGAFLADDVVEMDGVITLLGVKYPLLVEVGDGVVKVGNGEIDLTKVDILASHGVIHVVKDVLRPYFDCPAG